jgi:hypothetical protein
MTNDVSLSLLRQLLGADEDIRMFELVQQARVTARALPQLLISVLERDGVPLGTGSSDELARAKERARSYSEIATAVINAVASAKIVKGSSIAARYPKGTCRPVGDLDIVVQSEPHLWIAVQRALDIIPKADVDVSIFGNEQRHVIAKLSWPGVDPILDAERSVDICTAAFAGDFKTVRIRPNLPENPLVADLCSIGEERFQRDFGAKDVIDLLVLATQDLPSTDELLDTVDSLQLAPEVLELLEIASEYGDLGTLAQLRTSLPAAADRERKRRAPFQNGDSVLDGRPAHGFLLRRTAWQEDLIPAVLHDFSAGTLLQTPLGDYLMVSGEEVSTTDYYSAMNEVARLVSVMSDAT